MAERKRGPPDTRTNAERALDIAMQHMGQRPLALTRTGRQNSRAWYNAQVARATNPAARAVGGRARDFAEMFARSWVDGEARRRGARFRDPMRQLAGTAEDRQRERQENWERGATAAAQESWEQRANAAVQDSWVRRSNAATRAVEGAGRAPTNLITRAPLGALAAPDETPRQRAHTEQARTIGADMAAAMNVRRAPQLATMQMQRLMGAAMRRRRGAGAADAPAAKRARR